MVQWKNFKIQQNQIKEEACKAACVGNKYSQFFVAICKFL